MTPPDPRFRDQIAEALKAESCGCDPGWGHSRWDHSDVRVTVTTLLPTIAAEVEARVQAAANQRAIEQLERAAREDSISTHRLTPVEVLTLRVVKVEDLLARIAALASPAPAPHAEAER